MLLKIKIHPQITQISLIFFFNLCNP